MVIPFDACVAAPVRPRVRVASMQWLAPLAFLNGNFID
jgi:hypothetical protein